MYIDIYALHGPSAGGVGESAKGSPGPMAQPDRIITGRLALRAPSVSGEFIFN